MGNGMMGLGALLSLTLCVSCLSATEDDVDRDFEFFVEDGALEEVDFVEKLDFDEDGLSGEVTVTRPIDRERSGARFAWGGEVSRGYVHVIREELTYFEEQGFLEQGVLRKFEMWGVGGGAMGSPTVGDTNGDVVFMVPWRIDGTLYAGNGILLDALAYIELHADVGFGFQWKSLRPSVGIAFSSAVGAASTDVFFGEDEKDENLEAENLGVFFDVKFIPEGYKPVYGHLRAITGDYDLTTFGVGLRF